MNSDKAIKFFIGIAILIGALTYPAVLGALIFIAWVGWIWGHTEVDDTDKSDSERSGVFVVTDHATGIQYLCTPFGGITPRMNADGKPVRSAPDEG